MKIEKRGILAFIFLAVLLSALVSAEIDLKNIEIVTSYGPGQFLEGIFDLKLDEEPSNSLLKVIIEQDGGEAVHEIELYDFLIASKLNFTCEPNDCKANYTKQSFDDTVVLGSGENYVGLYIETGNEIVINTLSFNITGSGISESCGIPPVMIDLLDDGFVDWQYNKPGDFCSSLKSGSTYDESEATTDYEIGDVPYCEKIEVLRGGRFKLGVDMLNATPLSSLIMSINNIETGENAECNIIAGDGIRTCEVNFTVSEKKDYYICIQSSDEGNYKIKAETKGANCGKFGLEEFECADSTIDYGIYLQPAAFKVFTEDEIFNSESFNEFNPEDLVGYLQEYLDEEYGGSCDFGCVIPIKITSAQESVELSELKFEYTTVSGKIETNKIYFLDREEAKIDMPYREMQLSLAEFKVPSIYGRYNLKIDFGDEKIKNSVMRVEKVPIIESLKPTAVFAAIETEFSVFVSSPDNNSLMLYEWDFGDGNSKATDTPFVRHTYPSGTFILSLAVTDEEGLIGRKTFTINPLPPKEAVGVMIADKKSNLQKIAGAVSILPSWYKSLAISIINLEKIGSDLKSFEDEYLIAGADYTSIKLSLDEFPVYSGIKDDEIGLEVIVPDVDVSYLRFFGEVIEIGKEKETKNSIEAWLTTYIDVKLKSTIKVADADTSPEDDLDLVTVFEVILDAKESPRNNIYLIVQTPLGILAEELKIEDNQTIQNFEGAFGVLFDRVDSKSFRFALPGRVDSSELNVFASPTIEGLVQPDVYCGNTICEKSFGESYKTCPEDCSKPISRAALLTILVLILSGVGIYLIWKYYIILYEKKQIKKLFSSEKDFYSLTFFIANGLNKGIKESEMKLRLEKAEWKSSQIKFGLEKVKEQTKRVQKKGILNFTVNQLKSGKKVAEVRSKLGKAGWDVSLINWAVKKARKQVIK